jgi:hypothetical protein
MIFMNSDNNSENNNIDNNIPQNNNGDNSIPGDNPDSNINTNAANPLLDVQLNQIDRFAEMLFLLGTSFGFQAIEEVDRSYILKQEGELTSEEDTAFTYDIAKKLALANWIYLIAGSFVFENSAIRLNELEKVFPENPTVSDKERITGREMITTGNALKIIGYTLSAAGFEKIANSAVRESEPPEIEES